MNPMPPLFVSHGSPMIALEPGAAGRFMQQLGPAIERAFGRPRAVLAVSAHTLRPTDRPAPVLLGAGRHAAIHDFGAFDDRLFGLRYDAPGDRALADEAASRLAAAGLAATVADAGGLDHGIWTVMRHAWPDAGLPVVPLAWPARARPAALAALGQALAPLADDGVLVLASGSITHNLRRVFAQGMHYRPGQPEAPDSAAFRQWWHARAAVGDGDALADWARQAPFAAAMHPTDEHLLPWFVAAGAGSPARPALRLHAGVTFGCLGMDTYAFGAHAPRLAEALRADSAVAG
jgi:4,5-DOPA dioxygenase extradiol